MEQDSFDKQANTGIRHLLNATRFSLQGLAAAVKRESAFRQELALIVLLTPLGVWIAETLVEFALLLGVALMVLVVELLNSAIEAAIDRFGEKPHPLAGLAKDYGSAAVMISLIIAFMVWVAVALEGL